MTLPSEVKGFSPVIHVLTKEFGLVTAAVFGAVWRHCQMGNHVCTASLETIGTELGVDKATVLRHVKRLCDGGYLKDETPGLRNKPHTYSDTGKVKIAGLIEARTVAQDNTFPATVAERNATVAESQLKRVFKRDSKKKDSLKRAPAARPPAVQVFVEVTGKFALNNTQIKALAGKVGDGPAALARWRSVVEAWQLAGHKPTNITGMLDWFRDGIPQHGASNGTQQNTDPDRIPSVNIYDDTG